MDETYSLLGQIYNWQTELPDFEKLLSLSQISDIPDRNDQLSKIWQPNSNFKNFVSRYWQALNNFHDKDLIFIQVIKLEKKYLQVRSLLRSDIESKEWKKLLKDLNSDIELPNKLDVKQAEYWLDELCVNDWWKLYDQAEGMLKEFVELKLKQALGSLMSRNNSESLINDQWQKWGRLPALDMAEALGQEMSFLLKNYYILDPMMETLYFYTKLNVIEYNLAVLSQVRQTNQLDSLLVSY